MLAAQAAKTAAEATESAAKEAEKAAEENDALEATSKAAVAAWRASQVQPCRSMPHELLQADCEAGTVALSVMRLTRA